MKKIAKIAVGLTLAATVAATAGVLAGCNSGKTGEAYGLVHGAGYVGYAKIKVNDEKVKSLTLTEVCLPTQVLAGEDVAAAEKVTVGEGTAAKSYYKTVSYGEVTMTYDATDGYKVGTQKLVDYLATEANAKAYYEAVIGNKITVGSAKTTGVMTKAALSKEENGYWTKQDANKADYSRWKWNRDNTVNYVKEHGVSHLKTLTKSETKETDPKGTTEAGVNFWYDGNINTGATWSDLNASDKKGNAYYTYAELIVSAYNVAIK